MPLQGTHMLSHPHTQPHPCRAPAVQPQVLKALNSNSLGVNVVKTAGNLLSVRHGAERLQASWKGGAQTLAQVGRGHGCCGVETMVRV